MVFDDLIRNVSVRCFTVILPIVDCGRLIIAHAAAYCSAIITFFAIHFSTLPARCVRATISERQYLSFLKLRFGLPQPYALVLVGKTQYMFDASNHTSDQCQVGVLLPKS